MYEHSRNGKRNYKYVMCVCCLMSVQNIKDYRLYCTINLTGDINNEKMLFVLTSNFKKKEIF